MYLFFFLKIFIKIFMYNLMFFVSVILMVKGDKLMVLFEIWMFYLSLDMVVEVFSFYSDFNNNYF